MVRVKSCMVWLIQGGRLKTTHFQKCLQNMCKMVFKCKNYLDAMRTHMHCICKKENNFFFNSKMVMGVLKGGRTGSQFSQFPPMHKIFSKISNKQQFRPKFTFVEPKKTGSELSHFFKKKYYNLLFLLHRFPLHPECSLSPLCSSQQG